MSDVVEGVRRPDDNICFAVDMPETVGEAVREAEKQIVFLGDHYEAVDTQDFWIHSQNVARVADPTKALAKLAGFANPLKRLTPLEAVASSPTYAAVLDYSKLPPLNAFPVFAKVALRNTQRLHRLCREANASIGAGCFALAALVMMEMYETLLPGIPLPGRKPFISGFPLNPRAFFNHHNDPDSLMLAFSDGIALPFLSGELDLDGRIRLLARQAHRQLASYQKRSQPAEKAAELQYMSSRGAGRVLANQYISSVERTDALLPEKLRKNINPQGEFPMRPNLTMQTCGVSSVGRRDAFIKQGMYDLSDHTKDFVADFRNTRATVRPREGEFLIGIGSANGGLGVGVSIDGSSIDPALVRQWKDRLEHVLDEDYSEEKARL
ncbi:hypothetical protein LTR36_002634 [Oleoguttula mirabilis]|uniref:Uncharacterized protein n=1 Tax=Oleoguttula mirabilis TaxID=1507867 RepID=A0AAV9JJU6_9PEZI|nr:hypothetical protein LTR36_002634 [Oleoguttula mirabilis]